MIRGIHVLSADTMLFKGILEVNEAGAEIEKCLRKLIAV